MHKLLFLSLFLVNAMHALGQPDSIGISKEQLFKTGINFNQSTYSDNWKGGGNNAVSGAWFLNHFSSKKSHKLNAQSDLQLQLGYFQNQGTSIKKNVDRLFYDYKLGYRLHHTLDFFASLNLLSQFADGYDSKLKQINAPHADSLVSSLFAPAYFTSSLGLMYSPVEYMNVRFGLGTLRQTLVLDSRISNAGLYGLKKPGDLLRNQFVFQFVFNFNKELLKNINLNFRYMFNYDYLNVVKSKSIVQNLNMVLSLKANKLIQTNLSMSLVQDPDQDAKAQFAQVLGLGVVYQIQTSNKH